MTHAAAASRPKESEFYLPLIYLLGKLTGFKAYVGVSHEKVQDDVLRLAGYKVVSGPDDDLGMAVDEDGNAWPLKSKDSKTRDGLHRVVHFAWYHQTRKYRCDSESLEYCAKPVEPDLNKFRDERHRLLGLTESEAETLRSTKAKTAEKRRIRAKIKAKTRELTPARKAKLDKLDEQIRLLDNASRGMWALTELGVRKARELREVYEGQIALSAGPNATAKYIGENFKKLYDRITLSLRRRMPRSEMFDKVDDHAANWIERVIQRDGLRTRLEAGKSIPPSQACAWARRSAYTDIRNEGREPVCRVFHGALTKPEIDAFDPSNWTTEVVPRTINEFERLGAHSYAMHNEDDYVSDVIDNLADDHALAMVEQTILDGDALDHVMGRVAEILHEELDASHDPRFHEQLVHDRFIKEMSLREIAEAHGLTDAEDRVNVALNRVRDVMLRARDDGAFDDLITR